MFTLSASAKDILCDAEVISDHSISKGKEGVSQSFRFSLDEKNNLIVTDRSIKFEDCREFTFGFSVNKGKIEAIWSLNVDGRVSAYDGNLKAKSFEHLHSSDGSNLKLNCRIE
jgi:hypothetical protein